jgi:Siphovirus Gp157
MKTTGELSNKEIQSQFKQMSLRELCVEAAQLNEIIDNIEDDDELFTHLQTWLEKATQDKIDGYVWVANYLKLEIEEWKNKKAKLIEMCDEIIARKQASLDKLKDSLIELHNLGLIDRYLVGKNKAIEIRENNRPKITLQLSPDDANFPKQYKHKRTEWIADKDAIKEAYNQGEDISKFASVEVGSQVRFKNAPKRRS